VYIAWHVSPYGGGYEMDVMGFWRCVSGFTYLSSISLVFLGGYT
jgi:hypothetical protein